MQAIILIVITAFVLFAWTRLMKYAFRPTSAERGFSQFKRP